MSYLGKVAATNFMVFHPKQSKPLKSYTPTHILQGDTLAPFLFIIVIDYIMRISVDTMKEHEMLYQPRRSSRHPDLFITDANFADDNILRYCQIASPMLKHFYLPLNQHQTAHVSI